MPAISHPISHDSTRPLNARLGLRLLPLVRRTLSWLTEVPPPFLRKAESMPPSRRLRMGRQPSRDAGVAPGNPCS